jgi:hypothetical protein
MQDFFQNKSVNSVSVYLHKPVSEDRKKEIAEYNEIIHIASLPY